MPLCNVLIVAPLRPEKTENTHWYIKIFPNQPQEATVSPFQTENLNKQQICEINALLYVFPSNIFQI